eukprot:3676105-Pleurochrysis_carterae.AAC.2
MRTQASFLSASFALIHTHSFQKVRRVTLEEVVLRAPWSAGAEPYVRDRDGRCPLSCALLQARTARAGAAQAQLRTRADATTAPARRSAMPLAAAPLRAACGGSDRAFCACAARRVYPLPRAARAAATLMLVVVCGPGKFRRSTRDARGAPHPGDARGASVEMRSRATAARTNRTLAFCLCSSAFLSRSESLCFDNLVFRLSLATASLLSPLAQIASFTTLEAAVTPAAQHIRTDRFSPPGPATACRAPAASQCGGCIRLPLNSNGYARAPSGPTACFCSFLDSAAPFG